MIQQIFSNYLYSLITPPNKDEMLNSKKQNPVGRSVNTVDIANLVLFLCTQKSEMIRGQTIVLDGGYNLTT